MNSRTKSNEEYVEELKSKNPNIIPLEKYIGGIYKIRHKCIICDYEWNVMPKSLIYNKISQGCPNCASIKARKTLAKTTEQFSKEVDELTNGDFTVVGEYVNQSTDIDILCNTCHHIFKRRPANFLNSPKCPICDNRVCITGFNDIATTHPHLANLLKDKSIATRKTINNKPNEKHIFICPDCGKEIETSFYLLNKYGVKCPYCSDGISFPNKVITNLLLQSGIDFEREKSFDWSDGKIYDCYIEQKLCIIEMQGEQHYVNRGFNKIRGCSLEKQLATDKLKKENAINNGILKYYQIDCRKRDFEYIKNSIVKSGLLDYLDIDNVDWDTVYRQSIKSVVVEVCKYFSKYKTKINQLANLFKINKSTVNEYLKIGNTLGLCNYNPVIGNNQSTYL